MRPGHGAAMTYVVDDKHPVVEYLEQFLFGCGVALEFNVQLTLYSDAD